MGVMIGVAAGLGLGLVIGFVLGMESRWRCGDCLCNSENSHRTGYKTGFQEGVEAAVETVEQRAAAAGSRSGQVWIIEKCELERIREDLTETAYV